MSFFIFMMVMGVIKNVDFEGKARMSNFLPEWLRNILIFGVAPLAYTYFRFFYKKDIDYYDEKYKNHWLNKIYFDGLILIVPLFIFLTAPVLHILLFGGEMFTREYEGLLVFLFKK